MENGSGSISGSIVRKSARRNTSHNSSQFFRVIFATEPEFIQHLAQARCICINCNPTRIEVSCDEDRIVRVLKNLLSNAVKFSEGSAVVIVESKVKNDYLEFRVIDNGRGIPSAEIERVFQKYHQINSFDEAEKKGSGLGLTICKALVEAHEGIIGVSSEFGKGSIYWFRMPMEGKPT